MSNIVYNRAKLRVATGDLDIDSDTIKVILLGTAPNGGAAENPDTDDVASVLANAPELDCTGNTGAARGAGGTGRKTLTSTPSVDDTNNRANVAHSGASWTALSAGTDSAIAGYLIYEHVSGSDDALNFPIMYVNASPFSSVSLNGSDVSLPAGDWIRLA